MYFCCDTSQHPYGTVIASVKQSKGCITHGEKAGTNWLQSGTSCRESDEEVSRERVWKAILFHM